MLLVKYILSICKELYRNLYVNSHTETKLERSEACWVCYLAVVGNSLPDEALGVCPSDWLQYYLWMEHFVRELGYVDRIQKWAGLDPI